MKTIFKLTILSTLLLFSCTDKKPEQPAFLKYYKTTTLPVVMRGCKSDGLPLTSPAMLYTDSGTIKTHDGVVPYCTFATNDNYYATVTLGFADCTLPFIVTYDKNGKQIDEKFFAIGYCGGGPGYYCKEYAVIREDFSIYTSDTIREVEIDSLGNEVKSTEENYVLYKQGKILPSGKIELSDTIRKKL